MTPKPMKFAYADPPYLGCANRYPEKLEVDHAALIQRLECEFPDGWALSCRSPSLFVLAPLCPPGTRVGGWFKPFAVFRPNVNPAYAWEPVLFKGGRKRDRTAPTVRDWHSENITLQKGLVGAKPPGFNRWILDLLGYQDGDELVDIFPGTRSMAAAVAQGRLW